MVEEVVVECPDVLGCLHENGRRGTRATMLPERTEKKSQRRAAAPDDCDVMVSMRIVILYFIVLYYIQTFFTQCTRASLPLESFSRHVIEA